MDSEKKFQYHLLLKAKNTEKLRKNKENDGFQRGGKRGRGRGRGGGRGRVRGRGRGKGRGRGRERRETEREMEEKEEEEEEEEEEEASPYTHSVTKVPNSRSPAPGGNYW